MWRIGNAFLVGALCVGVAATTVAAVWLDRLLLPAAALMGWGTTNLLLVIVTVSASTSL